MYLAHFGFKKAPFAINSDPEFYFPFSSHEEARKMLCYSLTNQDLITLITGDVGAGKTSLIEHHCLTQNSHHCCVIRDPNCTWDQLIEMILMQLPIQAEASMTPTPLTLEKHLRHYHQTKRPVALIIDEAQAMSPEILESLRLLTNLKEGTAPSAYAAPVDAGVYPKFEKCPD
jgi:general secretion pathway protein A